VGQRGDDFDFRPHLRHIFPFVRSILLCLRIGNPEATLLIHAQVAQKLEEHIKIGAGFYSNEVLSGNIDANFPDHHVHQPISQVSFNRHEQLRCLFTV
jgi:hypothetical protein